MEIVSLLMDEFELIDWRWFLLSAAFPWPTPSLMQLLAVLQRFRAADMAHTGYVNEEQYLQVGVIIFYYNSLTHYFARYDLKLKEMFKLSLLLLFSPD